MVGMAIMGGYAQSGANQFVLGALQVYIFEDLGWKRSTIALALTIGTWSSALVTPFVGRLADRYGPRWLMAFGALVAGCAFLSLSNMTAIWHFYVTFIVARVLCSPTLGGVVASTTVVNWFHKKRNTAMGLVSMSHPLGSSINVQLLQLLVAIFSWRVAYQFLGVFTLCLVSLFIFTLRRRPEDLGMRPDGDKPGDDLEATQPAATHARRGRLSSATPPSEEFAWTAREAIRTLPFWLLTLTLAMGTLGISSINFNMVPYMRDQGISAEFATSVLAISGIVGAIGNTVWGWLSDRFTPRKCEMVAFAAAATIVILLLNVNSVPLALAFALVWGIASRGEGVLGQMIVAQFYGRHAFGSIVGIMAPFQTIMLGLGPTLGALVRDTTGSYRPLYALFVLSYALSAFLIYLTRMPKHPALAISQERLDSGTA